MNKCFNLDALISYCGIDNMPEEASRFYSEFEFTEAKSLLSDSLREEILAHYTIPEDKWQLLMTALKCIEEDEKLLYFTQFLVWDIGNSKIRLEYVYMESIKPAILGELAIYYPLIVVLALIEPARTKLSERGVPTKYYLNTPHLALSNQIQSWVETSDPMIKDFPWDLNFYTCSIYRFDRFYFVPERWEENIVVYQNNAKDHTIALAKAGIELRHDGQVNGTNEIYDNNYISTVWKESNTELVAHRVNPMGIIELEAKTWDKQDYSLVLGDKQYVLAFHIPSGEGYTPERVKNSMGLALDFFDKYFFDMPIDGFWSESWLYDPRLRLVLDTSTSHIIHVQDEFYCYPTKNSDEMLIEHLFPDGDWKNEKARDTSLTKKVRAKMLEGVLFTTTSMFLLRQDVLTIGQAKYSKAKDQEEYWYLTNQFLLKESL